jgi:TonB family protein
MSRDFNHRTDLESANSPTAGFPDELFKPLPGRDWSWRSISASLIIHCAVLALLICVPLLLHREMPVMDVVFLAYPPPRLLAPRVPPPRPPETEQHKWIEPAVLPPPVPRPEPEPVPRLELPKRDPLPEKVLRPDVPPPPPLPAPPRPERAETPKPEVRTNVFDSTTTAAAPKRSGDVRTDVFGGDSEAATTRRPAREVQTGGFGSPTDNAAEPSPLGKAQRPTLGSFDLPQGPGSGNGTGGNRGVRAVVASAGFGSGAADSGNGSTTGRAGTVQSGGFSDMGTATPATAPRTTKAEEPDLKPVEIISKPKPVYTVQARELGLQGEVQVEVVFTSTGAVKVLRIARGLGHGLDEAAVKAAEQIRFKPAQRDGRAVDFKAIVNIIFRLA